ncbi:MAG: transcriptional regulator, TetR family [Solirubrobacterales bacterium]|nr:transcriptional regulator, TetR family [Solirubrobacterales bacterium]
MVDLAAGTRERLLHAALELTREGGYAQASVAAIAAGAGVSNGALYRHWSSKGELFAELFRTVCSRELEALTAAGLPRAEATVVERVEAVLGTFAARALRNPRLAWALIAEPVDPLVEAERLAYRRTYRQHLAALLRKGIAVGELPEQDADLTAAALVGGVGEALVGPTSPVADTPPDADVIVAALQCFARRAVGAVPPATAR